MEAEEEETDAPTTIDSLPDEILAAILRYLPLEAVINAEFVCEKWYRVSRSKSIWKRLAVEYDCKKCNFADFIDLLEGHSELVSVLVFRNVHSYSEIRSVLNLCRNLTELRLYMCGVNNKIAKDLQNYPHLKALSLKNCYSQWGKIEPLSSEIDFDKFDRLEELILTDFGLHDGNFEGLIGCRRLACLVIDKIKTVSQDSMMRLLRTRRDTLRVVWIYGLYYDDRIVECAMDCPNLTHFGMTRCERLTDASVRILRDRSHLRQLSLWNNRLFTPAALEEFLAGADLVRLNYVSFSKIKYLTERHLTMMAAKCPALEFVGIYLCPMLNSKRMGDEVERLFCKSKVVFE